MRGIDILDSRDYLTFVYLCPTTVFAKYQPNFDPRLDTWSSWSPDGHPDWLLLTLSFHDEATQTKFEAEAGVLPLPHHTDTSALSPGAKQQLTALGLTAAPTNSIDAFVTWAISNATPSVGGTYHQMKLRAARRKTPA